jgi:hypothetical protein
LASQPAKPSAGCKPALPRAVFEALMAYPGFPETGRELALAAGTKAAWQLINAWGGQTFPVPKISERSREDGKRLLARIKAVVGEEAAFAIVRHYGGCELYIPNCRKVFWQFFQARLVDDYTELTRAGLSHRAAVFELGLRYHRSGRLIEQQLNKPLAAGNPQTAQAALF